MSNYTQSVNFGAKDALPTQHPNKRARGSEIDTELGAIETAVATKVDKVLAPTAGNAAILTASGGISDAGLVPFPAANLPNVTIPSAVSSAQLDFLTTSGLTQADLQKLADTNTSAAELNDLAGNAVDAADFTKLSQIASSAAAIDAAVTDSPGAAPAATGYTARAYVYVPNTYPVVSTTVLSSTSVPATVVIPNVPAGAVAHVEWTVDAVSLGGGVIEFGIELSAASGPFTSVYSGKRDMGGGEDISLGVVASMTNVPSTYRIQWTSALPAPATVTVKQRVLGFYL